MAQYIDVPEAGGLIEFPDDMSQEEIVRAVEVDILKIQGKDKEQKQFLPMVVDTVRAVGAGAVDVVGSTIKGVGELYGAGVRSLERGAEAVLPESVSGALTAKVLPWWATPEQIAIRGGEPIKDVAEIIRPPKEVRGLHTDIAEGVGQLGGQAAMYVLSGGTTGMTTLLAQGADQMAERLEKSNIPQADKDTAIALGAAITGMSEKIGLDLLLKRMPPVIKSRILRIFTDIAAAAGIEASQEAAEGFLHNATVKLLAKADESLTKGLAYESLVAGGSAGIVRTALRLAFGKKFRIQEEQEDLRSAIDEAKGLRDDIIAAEAELAEEQPVLPPGDEQKALPHGAIVVPGPVAPGKPLVTPVPKTQEGVRIFPSPEAFTPPTTNPEVVKKITEPEVMVVPEPTVEVNDAVSASGIAPEDIATKLNIIYNGVQEMPKGMDDLYLYTDRKTGGTFSVKDLSEDAVRTRLEEKRIEFAGTPHINDTITPPTERRVDTSTRAEIERLHQKAKEQGIESITDEEVTFMNRYAEGRAIDRIVRDAAGIESAVRERKERKKGKAEVSEIAETLVEEPKREPTNAEKFPDVTETLPPLEGIDPATQAIRKRVLKTSGRDWVESFDEYREEAIAEGRTSTEANGIALKRVKAESNPAAVRKVLRGLGQVEKPTGGKPVQKAPVEAATAPPLVQTGETGGSTGEMAISKESEGQAPPPTAEEVKAARLLLPKILEQGFENMASEEQALLTKTGVYKTAKLSDEVVDRMGEQRIGSSKKASVTVDFFGLQTSFEAAVDKIMDAAERIGMDRNVSKDDMRMYIINEWLQTPSDIAKALPKLGPIIAAQELRDKQRNLLEHKYAEETKQFWRLSDDKQNGVSQILFRGDREKREYGEPELRDMGMDDAQVLAYLQVRNALNSIRDEYVALMRESGAMEVEIVEYVKNSAGFMPHMRFGTKALVVQSRDENGNWKTLELEAFELKRTGGGMIPTATASMLRRKALKAAMNRGPKAQWVKTDTGYVAKDGSIRVNYEDLRGFASEHIDNLPSSAHFESILGEVRAMQERMKVDKKTAEEIISATRAALSKKRMIGGFSRHWVKRENIPGYSEDGGRVLAQYFNGYAGYRTKFDAALKMYEALSEIHPAKEKRLYKYSSQYIDYVLKHSGPELHQLKAFMFYWYIGGNIKSAMMNGTQNFLTAAPALSVYSGRSGYRLITKAMADVARFKLTADENNFLGIMRAEGVTKDLLTSELTGRPNNVFQKHVSPGLLNALRYFFGSVERFNRETTALAFYRAGKARGLSAEQLEADVTKAVKDTHFGYGKANRPKLGRGVKSPILTFRLFSINYVQFIKNLVKDGEYTAAGKSVGVMLALSGVKGLFLFELVNDILGWFGGPDLEERTRYYTNKAAEALLGKAHKREVQALERMMTRGIPAAFGLDFSGSLGAGDMIPSGDLWDIAGAPAGLGKRFLIATRDFKAGDYRRGIEGISPEFVKNPLMAIRLLQEGLHTHGGMPKVGRDGKVFKLTPFQASLKAVGIQPVVLSEHYKKADVRRREVMYRTQLKSTYLDGIAVAWAKGDMAQAREIWMESVEYDKGQPFYNQLMIRVEDVKGRMYERAGMKEQYRKMELDELFGE